MRKLRALAHLPFPPSLLSLLSLLSFSFFLSFSLSCSSPKSAHDADTVTPDGDIPAADEAAEIETDDFISVEADELLTDVDAGPDEVYCVVDENPDADIEYIPNAHTGNEECPVLASAKFPYYDTDGTIHFCRKCDQVRKKDPQCMKNMYAEDNLKLCTEKPQYDCYDYPCDMPWLQPIYKDERYTGMHECDIALNAKNPTGWTTGISTFKHFNISNGEVGFYFDNVNVEIGYENNIKAMRYNIASKKYQVSMAPQGSALSYHNGNYLLSLSDPNVSKKDYIAYIKSDGSRSITYNSPIRMLLYNPALNDTWAFAVINIVDGQPYEMSYAKIGEWKWQSIGQGVANEPFIVGDRLVFYTDDFKGYFCDLDKSPKALFDCKVINRENEEIRTPTPDMTNDNLIYYENANIRDRLFRVDVGKTPWVYEELPIQEIETNTYMSPINHVNGNVFVYRNNFDVAQSSGNTDSKLCFYRVDQKKSYCMKPIDHIYSGDVSYIKHNYSYSEFEDNYLVWQLFTGDQTYIRDMDCYCAKEDVCPFE